MPIIDLSHPITSGMPVYPGDPQVRIELALSVPGDGVAVHALQLGSHSGTHLDAPAHSIVGGRTVEQLSLDQLCGPALILQATPKAHAPITLDAVRAQLPTELPTIVCIASAWDAHFTTPHALAHPHLTLELVTELWARGARVLGVDMLSPDPSAPTAVTMPVHEFWLGNDGVIVENLLGLRALPPRCTLSMLPLPLAGVDGSPVRAVAYL